MIYPGTSSVGMGNASEEAKKRLIQSMSKRSGALPLYGGRGRSANDLQQVGAPAIGFNPFLKMLAGRPGENFGLDNNPGIQNGPGPIQGGGSPLDPMTQGFQGSSVPTTGAGTAPPQAAPGMGGVENSGGFGHYNPSANPGGISQPGGTYQTLDPGLSGLGQSEPTDFQSLDPATQLLLLNMHYGGLSGYNQER